MLGELGKLKGGDTLKEIAASRRMNDEVKATVIVAAALRAMTFRLVVVSSILMIAVLMVTRWWGRKRVGGTGSYVLAPTHG